MNKKRNCTILVLSCDKYSDLWEPFFYCFHKYWPDCPYPIILGSNTRIYKDKEIRTVLSGPDKDWSTSFLLILKQIREENVLLWLDDIFLTSDIDKKAIDNCFSYLSDGAKHIHISQVPKPDCVGPDDIFGVLDKKAPYRVNALGFWTKTELERILIEGESPWNFEIMGSYRSSYQDGYYTLLKKPFSYLNVVEKGKFFSGMKQNLRKLGVRKSLVRDELAIAPKWKSNLQKLYFNMMVRVSWKTRLKIMDLLRKLLISY